MLRTNPIEQDPDPLDMTWEHENIDRLTAGFYAPCFYCGKGWVLNYGSGGYFCENCIKKLRSASENSACHPESPGESQTD